MNVADQVKSRASRKYSYRAITAGAVGNFIEFYDAALYTLLAPVFAQQFFPVSDKALSLLYTYGAVVAVSFVIRPIATVLISPIGDRYGRRRLLALTLLIMAGGLSLIAATPDYRTIGVFAPVLLVIGRIAQNISNSGEYQAAASFMVEHAPPHRRATVGSLQAASAALGILCATSTVSLLTLILPHDRLVAWGWRVPFVIGALLCLVGVHLRRHVPESPLFETLAERGRIDPHPLRTTVGRHKASVLLVVVQQISQVGFFTWQVFLPTYANLVGGLPLATGLQLNVVALAVFTLALPLTGMLSDRIGRKPLVIAESVGLAICACPLLSLLNSPTPATYLFVAITGNLLLALSHGSTAALFCELFPTGVRASGIGVPYNMATVAFGGSAPILATWSISRHHPLFLAYYITAVEVVAALVFLFVLRETRWRSLDAIPEGQAR
ncbi:MFS transporter [Streptomyces sp. NPDC053048]|uniref:MFS transporter n=1 Tax=Streptomyces sp. NPDC053048 TaxID=3365694 RepID=UPI0037D04835